MRVLIFHQIYHFVITICTFHCNVSINYFTLLYKKRDNSLKFYKNLQEPQKTQKNAKNVKKRVFFVFLGVKQKSEKNAFLGQKALWTPEQNLALFEKCTKNRGLQGGPKKRHFSCFFAFFTKNLQKKYFIE